MNHTTFFTSPTLPCLNTGAPKYRTSSTSVCTAYPSGVAKSCSEAPRDAEGFSFGRSADQGLQSRLWPCGEKPERANLEVRTGAAFPAAGSYLLSGT